MALFARICVLRGFPPAAKWYAAQVISQIDGEIAEKDNFWVETRVTK